MPRLIIMAPPIIKSSRMTVVNPSTAAPMKYTINVSTPRAMEQITMMNPTTAIIRSGAVVKDVVLVMAYLTRLPKDHLLVPFVRSATSYST